MTDASGPEKRGPDKGYAEGQSGTARLVAPAAERNRDAIVEGLRDVIPPDGRALEIASGTGQHVVHFSNVWPTFVWQPSDPAPDRRASIADYARDVPEGRILPPIDLDACKPGWSENHGPFDLIFLANLIHLISQAEAEVLLSEIAKALAPKGTAALYGPYLRNGQATSDGDAAFDARIRAENPQFGYKDKAWVEAQLETAGLRIAPARAMPANNLILLAHKSGT